MRTEQLGPWGRPVRLVHPCGDAGQQLFRRAFEFAVIARLVGPKPIAIIVLGEFTKKRAGIRQQPVQINGFGHLTAPRGINNSLAQDRGGRTCTLVTVWPDA